MRTSIVTVSVDPGEGVILRWEKKVTTIGEDKRKPARSQKSRVEGKHLICGTWRWCQTEIVHPKESHDPSQWKSASLSAQNKGGAYNGCYLSYVFFFLMSTKIVSHHLTDVSFGMRGYRFLKVWLGIWNHVIIVHQRTAMCPVHAYNNKISSEISWSFLYINCLLCNEAGAAVPGFPTRNPTSI